MKIGKFTRREFSSFMSSAFIFYCLGISIAWADLVEEFGAGIQVNGTGPVLQTNGDKAAKLFNQNQTSRIVGGHVSVPHSHPYIVDVRIKLEDGGQFRCGGVILTEEWALTAAHCVDGALWIKLTAGKHDISKHEGTEQKTNATHYLADLFDPETAENDIALIKVTPKFKFNKYVKPGVLARADFNPTGMATVTGWGSENAVAPDDEDRLKDHGHGLREVDVPVITNEQCSEWMAPHSDTKIFESNICAGYWEGKKDACQGDSGGPLFQKMENGEEIVIGLVSWGEGCAQPKIPGVYTRVNKFLKYIRQHTGYNNAGDGGNLLTSDVAENLCHQYFTYLAKDCITEPVPTPPPSHLKCGWFNWTKNCSQSSCNPFSFSKC